MTNTVPKYLNYSVFFLKFYGLNEYINTHKIMKNSFSENVYILLYKIQFI